MLGKLETAYNKIIDSGLTVNDVYIYSRIMEDVGTYLSDEEVEHLYKHIKHSYANDDEWRTLDYHINTALNDGEADIVW